MLEATAYSTPGDLGSLLVWVLLMLVGFPVLFFVGLALPNWIHRWRHREAFAEQKRRNEAQRKREEENQRRRNEKHKQDIAELTRRNQLLQRSSSQWPETLLDEYLKWIWSKEGRFSELNFRHMAFTGIVVDDWDYQRARDRAQREGLAVFRDGRWRLTSRGRRIFEQYAGDRKSMNEEEKKRHQPNVTIDARWAGNVAHTIEGGVHGTIVNNNLAPSRPAEVDLQAVLHLVQQLRLALPETDRLSDLARERAEGDLGEVDRELRASEEDRDPGRVRAALERLQTTFAGVEGLLTVVNQVWDHLRVWFSAG